VIIGKRRDEFRFGLQLGFVCCMPMDNLDSKVGDRGPDLAGVWVCHTLPRT